MIRKILVASSMLALLGAFGLLLFGGALINLFVEALLFDTTAHPGSAPPALARLSWAAGSGMAFSLGLLACTAIVVRHSHVAMNRGGRVLFGISSLLVLLGAVACLAAVMGAKRGFAYVATSTSIPQPDELPALFATWKPAFHVGSALLLAGAVALALACVVGQRAAQRTPPRTGRSPLDRAAPFAAAFFGALALLLFAGIWSHGRTLQSLLAAASATAPHPAKLAAELAGILNMSLFAFIAIACAGIMQLVTTLFGPTEQPSS